MKHWAKKMFAKLGYHVQGTRYCPRHLLEPRYLCPIELADVICRRMFECGPELTFIQIGTFDGITKDPLYKYIERYGWRGIMVEPQPRPASPVARTLPRQRSHCSAASRYNLHDLAHNRNALDILTRYGYRIFKFGQRKHAGCAVPLTS